MEEIESRGDGILFVYDVTMMLRGKKSCCFSACTFSCILLSMDERHSFKLSLTQLSLHNFNWYIIITYVSAFL